jgi:putative lipoprotein
MGARHARDIDVIQHVVVALLLATADTGQVKAERTVSIYSPGSINHVNYSPEGINPYSTAQPLPADRWFGEDKFKHFALSYMITVGGYAGARFVAGHDESVWIGAGVGLAAGIAKELYDRRTNRSASLRDLLWDAAGVATGIIVAAHTR